MGLSIHNEQFRSLKGRLAPTPSGFLHKGNAFSFVLTWLLVRKRGGKLLLRIDDADTSRARGAYLDDIFYCLDWLQLDWDEGPVSPDHFRQHFSQEHRFGAYHQLLEVLQQQGHLYACDCSRSQIRDQSATGLYSGTCRQRQISFNNLNAAWRVAVPEEEICFREAERGNYCISLASRLGDFVVRRKEGYPAYQIASLADDMHWNINFIVRGEDLYNSTAAQVYLAQLLAKQTQDNALREAAGYFTQASFLHHPLLLNEHGEKLSKSAGSTALKSLRAAGGNPLPIYALVASYLKLPADAAASLQDMLQAMKD